MMNKKVYSELLEPQIIKNVVYEGVKVEEEDVYFLKQENTKLANGLPYVLLVVSESFSTISDGAMALSSSSEFKKQTKAKALLVNSLPHKLIGNFYIKMKKPAIRTKLFTDQEMAMKWLRKELKKG